MGVNISKVVHWSSKIIIGSCCLVHFIGNKYEAPVRLHNTVKNATKEIKIIYTNMGYMVVDSHNNKMGMKYYASKIHQFDKQVDFSKIHVLSQTWFFACVWKH